VDGPNKHRGSSFDSFLREDGLFDEVQAAAVKRAISEAVEEGRAAAGLSKVEMARRMRTSRSQLDRVLDPACTTVQLDTLIKAATAVGQELRFTLKRAA
jgi:antitoxin HicB